MQPAHDDLLHGLGRVRAVGRCDLEARAVVRCLSRYGPQCGSQGGRRGALDWDGGRFWQLCGLHSPAPQHPSNGLLERGLHNVETVSGDVTFATCSRARIMSFASPSLRNTITGAVPRSPVHMSV